MYYYVYYFFILQLKRELESFGPDFFEEIEDLKYNYKQMVERCSLLETKLKQLARQFGVSVGIPGID
jgi:centrosomal protein CEP290